LPVHVRIFWEKGYPEPIRCTHKKKTDGESNQKRDLFSPQGITEAKYYTSKMAGVKRIHTRTSVCAQRINEWKERVAERKKLIFFFSPPVFRDENLNNRLSWALADTYLRIYLSSFLF
jgi:hypothetical protein